MKTLRVLGLLLVASVVTGCGSGDQDAVADEAPIQGRAASGMPPAPGAVRAHVPTAASPYDVCGGIIPGSPAPTDAYRMRCEVIVPTESGWTAQHVAIGDVTGDGKPDVVGSAGYGGPVYVPEVVRVHVASFNGPGAPAVSTLSFPGLPSSAHGMTLADLDGDGVDEIVVESAGQLTIAAHKNGQWSYRRLPSIQPARYLAPIDANSDGAMDVFAQSWSSGAHVYFADGKGGIDRHVRFDNGAAGYNTVRTADVDGDGRPDVTVTNGQGWPKVWHYINRFGTNLDPAVEYDLRPTVSSPVRGIAVGDVDGDGLVDLVVSQASQSGEPNGLRIFHGGLAHATSRSSFLRIEGQYQLPAAIAITDLDGDSRQDLVVGFDSEDSLAYFRQGPDGFAAPVRMRTDDSALTVGAFTHGSFRIADIDLNGCPDIALAHSATSLRVYFGENCRTWEPVMGGPLPPLSL